MYIFRRTIINDFQHNIAFNLIEKFRCFIVVIIFSAVWAAHYHHDKIAIFPHHFIAYRRLQQVPVFLNPFLEIYRRNQIAHNILFLGVPLFRLSYRESGFRQSLSTRSSNNASIPNARFVFKVTKILFDHHQQEG